jgi:hypothetical protein
MDAWAEPAGVVDNAVEYRIEIERTPRIKMVFKVTATAASYLERLAEELDVPTSRYEEAQRRYHSVGDWLGREESGLKDYSPEVYVQGSFRLGTPIRPVNDDEHYDIDLVCELSMGKHDVTQKELKAKLGVEMNLYAKRYSMEPASEGRRCWTLEYAEGAQFHLDALPAIPDGEGRRKTLEARNLNAAWSKTAVAITDTECETFQRHSQDWPHSNPKGFTEWFRSRMKVVFTERRMELALEAKANVEDVPAYKVKTPLQQVVQILKRHRDMRFADKPDVKPISVIITTLAAKSYSNQLNVSDALAGILDTMMGHIQLRDGVYWIENPTDPAENFADRWQSHPDRKDAFFEWVKFAREDFAHLASQSDLRLVTEAAGRSLGNTIARKVETSSRQKASGSSGLKLFQKFSAVLSAVHRQTPPWTIRRQGKVRISRARVLRVGFRPSVLLHEADPVAKGAAIEFSATTDVVKPYSVYWQIVNTGAEATSLQKLRGDFSTGVIVKGDIMHEETAAYEGTHSIECFIVKDNTLAARSGAFVVKVK